MSDGNETMSTHDDAGHATEVATTESAGQPAARFDNPGLPEHQHRVTDVDPKAAKRAERQVALMFLLSVVGTLIVLVTYFSVKYEGHNDLMSRLTQVQHSTVLMGLGMFLALFGIGAGAVHWAKTLMPDDERVEYRHLQRSSEEDRAAAVGILREGAEEVGLGRRPLIRNTLIGALALFPLPAVVLLRDTGPMPGRDLETTVWKQGTRLVKDPEGGAVKASDLTLGSIVHIMPEGIEKTADPAAERAKAAVLLVRLDPADLNEESKKGAYEGIVAYSKICTHLGCPVALYEQRTHHLLCPCHQSTFDLTDNCRVVFGPAKRPLPQLPITVDDEGYLVAAAGFNQPVGPSFWERA
ncbi:MAG TPA: Rieske 2Fe-2S domain-containing protein [Kineosporiaceae bacterium]|nr:Rieske 2Fe-2S domain-containing protein [Kineosporiaceae bacterium]